MLERSSIEPLHVAVLMYAANNGYSVFSSYKHQLLIDRRLMRHPNAVGMFRHDTVEVRKGYLVLTQEGNRLVKYLVETAEGFR